MASLIKLIQCKDGARISSLLISEKIATSYKATNNLIRKHKKRMESLGELPFEKAADSKSGRAKPALLNEDQSIFLLTLSRNTEQVVEFKLALTKEFAKLRRKQALIDENHAKDKWQQNRELGIHQRHDITDAIKQFVIFAKDSGSNGADHYYFHITRLVNTALGIEDRDSISAQQLAMLETAEAIAEKVLTIGVKSETPYKLIWKELKAEITTYAGLLPEAASGLANG